VAELAMSRRQVAQLRYREDYVAERGEGALGLTVPLPVSSRRYKGELVDYWIESLLPEGETRTVLEQFFWVRRGDGFALLTAVGRGCAGAAGWKSFFPGANRNLPGPQAGAGASAKIT
jgi:HipA-like protein